MSENENVKTEQIPALFLWNVGVSRGSLFLKAVLALILGCFLLFEPVDTLKILTQILGMGVIFSAGTVLGGAGALKGTTRWFTIIYALALIISGVIAVIHPLLVNWLWILLLALWQIFSGVRMLAFYFQHEPKVSGALSTGLISLVFGIILGLFPLMGLISAVWVFGVLVLLYSAGMFALYFRTR